jgi:hypothetical protein
MLSTVMPEISKKEKYDALELAAIFAQAENVEKINMITNAADIIPDVRFAIT